MDDSTGNVIVCPDTKTSVKTSNESEEDTFFQTVKKQSLVGEVPQGFLSMPTTINTTNGAPSSYVSSSLKFNGASSITTDNVGNHQNRSGSRSSLRDDRILSHDVQGSSNHLLHDDFSESFNVSTLLAKEDEERRQQEEADRLAAEKLQNDEYAALDLARAEARQDPQQALSASRVQSYESSYVDQPLQTVTQLKVSVIQAKLFKGYSITRMDPYVNIHVGPKVYSTKPSYNGDKNPRWDETFVCPYKSGVRSLRVEVFDQKTFTSDVLLAWTDVPLTEELFGGQFQDKWYSLYTPSQNSPSPMSTNTDSLTSDGTINLVISYRKVPVRLPHHTRHSQPKREFIIGQSEATITNTPVSIVREISPEDISTLCEMFPDVEESTVRMVLEQHKGDTTKAADSLISMVHEV